MPATSSLQAHTAQMALAYKRGHLALKDVPRGAQAAVRSMAKMTTQQLGDYMHMAPHAPTHHSVLGG